MKSIHFDRAYAMFLIIFFFLAGWVILHHVRVMMKRKEEIAKFAEEAGLESGDKVVSGISFRFCNARLFKMGDFHNIQNAFEAETEEARVSVFDYSPGFVSDRNSEGSSDLRLGQTVVAIESDELVIPQFVFVPFRAFSNRYSRIGWPRMQLASEPGLSTMLALFGEEPELVEAFLTKPLREFIRKYPHGYFESCRHALLFCIPGELSQAQDLGKQIEFGLQFFDVVRSVQAESKNVQGQLETAHS